MLRYAFAAAAILLLTSAADARTHRGACDGIHRCRCGSTQTAHFGLPRIYNGHNLWRAVEWIRAFPRTSIHPGAVGYVRHGGPSGHVFRVTAYNGGATATVSDDRGTYERRITNAIFVDPTQTFSAKSRHHIFTQVAAYDHAVGTF